MSVIAEALRVGDGDFRERRRGRGRVCRMKMRKKKGAWVQIDHGSDSSTTGCLWGSLPQRSENFFQLFFFFFSATAPRAVVLGTTGPWWT